MPPKINIPYAPAAVDDMDEIFSYISLDNVEAAEHPLNQLALQIPQPGEFPSMGSVLPEDEYTLLSRGYRFIVVHPYLVFYRPSATRLSSIVYCTVAAIICGSCLEVRNRTSII